MDLNKKKTLKTKVSSLIMKKDLDAKSGRKTQVLTFEKKRKWNGLNDEKPENRQIRFRGKKSAIWQSEQI